MIAFSLIIMISFAGVATLGQKIWIGQEKKTTEFEICMGQAAFKSSKNKPDSIGKLSPEDLERHFMIFDQIFKDTGLPPIWDGNQLIPWKIYHKESIIVASQCHKKIGITKPQEQLRGTYSKPVWDPNSDIWKNDEYPRQKSKKTEHSQLKRMRLSHGGQPIKHILKKHTMMSAHGSSDTKGSFHDI